MPPISTNPQSRSLDEPRHDEGTRRDLVPVGDVALARLRRLWTERLFLAKALVFGLAVGIVVGFLLPKRYQSSTQLMSPDNQSGSGLLMALAGGAGNGLGAVAGDLLGARSSADQFVAILRSRTVQDRLVQQFDLKKVYRVKLDEDARKELGDSTTIETDRKSGVITMEVTDNDPHRARALAQAYIEQLNRLTAEMSTSAARQERIFLEERLNAVQQELERAEHNFSDFASKNTAVDIPAQGKAMLEAASRLQGELIVAESELKGLEQIYSSSNIRVRSVSARVQELQRQLGKLGGETPGQESPGQTDGLSAGGSSSPYPSIRQLPTLGVTYFDLFRQTKIQEAVLEALTKEYEMAKVQEAKETPVVKILDDPNLPERRSFPPRMLILFLCACCSLVGAAGVVFISDRWERTDAADPRKLFAQEVLGAVNSQMPWASPNGSRVQAATHQAWIKLVRRKESVGESD